MKCYICQTSFGPDGTDCPGCCQDEKCRTACDERWDEFLKAKHDHIARVMREAIARGEKPYIHILPRKEQ